jgi:hypothetical protein
LNNVITAFRRGELRPLMRCAVKVRPPEVVFPQMVLGNEDPEWDMQGDIWSLGCTVSALDSL